MEGTDGRNIIQKAIVILDFDAFGTALSIS